VEKAQEQEEEKLHLKQQQQQEFFPKSFREVELEQKVHASILNGNSLKEIEEECLKNSDTQTLKWIFEHRDSLLEFQTYAFEVKLRLRVEDNNNRPLKKRPAPDLGDATRQKSSKKKSKWKRT